MSLSEDTPLTPQDLVIKVGKYGCRLNLALINRQGLSPTEVRYIKHLHEIRLGVEQDMREAPTGFILKGFYSCWLDIQGLLQDAWKFERDEKFIRFWDVPRCTCPRLDNEDRYPSGYYVINSDCPVHGGK